MNGSMFDKVCTVEKTNGKKALQVHEAVGFHESAWRLLFESRIYHIMASLGVVDVKQVLLAVATVIVLSYQSVFAKSSKSFLIETIEFSITFVPFDISKSDLNLKVVLWIGYILPFPS